MLTRIESINRGIDRLTLERRVQVLNMYGPGLGLRTINLANCKMPATTTKEFIETDTGNKVSRRSKIRGSQNIILGGKTIIQSDCTIRGDLKRAGAAQGVVVAIGRYCLLDRGCLIQPPCKIYKGVFSYYPMKIGDHVHIGQGSTVEAATIGSFVKIGKNCVIGKFAIIKECVRIEDDTIIPANTVIPSFSIVSGRPGLVVAELPESTQELYDNQTRDYFASWRP
ncbi:Dynactin subunit 5 [Neolecta irregularis DAH-3]|uniref:Dynactin subunit 5 n=1 Tax=Neolecta irregularis (strain DAH-3) TaxID=1198029 RepID=A0A1U7LKM5_NEOID|nr:Dynactin subunit 5 [Neolecta irregularis DAH-3]|eukprot:OLL23188.1 Dynactin subunit 5 [Neolecta irregularis DAH-3]